MLKASSGDYVTCNISVVLGRAAVGIGVHHPIATVIAVRFDMYRYRNCKDFAQREACESWPFLVTKGTAPQM